MLYRLSPFHLSLALHLLVILTGTFIVIRQNPIPSTMEVEVVETPLPQNIQNLSAQTKETKVVLKNLNKQDRPELPSREVFGINKNVYTDNSNAESVETKRGNTLAKEADNLVLNNTDAEALPVPTEEYLVSQMPVVMTEVRPVYPKQAKDNQLEGRVVLNVLIDQKGKVREVFVLEGPEIFRLSAIEAMKKFIFSPAQVDGKPVAVRIRYSLNFKLEY